MNDEMIFEKSIYHYRFGTDTMSNKTFDQQKKETSFLLKQHCSKAENLHFLIGSGCSLPAIPLMGKTTFSALVNGSIYILFQGTYSSTRRI